MLANGVLKSYFLEELEALRRSSVRFAEDYPVVASALALNAEPSKDPHVELLLQSFAFLTGQLRCSLDAQDTELPNQLLETFCPQLASPLPSLAVVQVDVSAGSANFAAVNSLPARTEVTADGTWNGQPQTCRFTTLEPLALWPIQVVEVRTIARNDVTFDKLPVATQGILHVKVKTLGPKFFEMPIDSLRFFLSGRNQYRLYDAIESHLLSVVCRSSPSQTTRTLALAKNNTAVGSCLPATDRVSHPGLALLREYFTFPERFLFVTLADLQTIGCNNELDLYFLFDCEPPLAEIEDFRLNCVSVANLFHKRLEPIALRSGCVEYEVLGERYQRETCEVQSIEALTILAPAVNESRLLPLYGAHDTGCAGYWSVRREVSQYPSIPGTEAYVTLVNQDFEPTFRPGTSVGGTVWCSQRRLAESCQVNQPVRLRSPLALQGRFVTASTQHQSPELTRDGATGLCSQLSSYALPLYGGSDALRELKRVLALHFSAGNARAQQQINGLKSLTHARIAEYLGKEAWHGAALGTELLLTVDSSSYTNTSALLFGEILDECFAAFAPANSFVVFQMTDIGGDTLRRWPIRLGADWS